MCLRLQSLLDQFLKFADAGRLLLRGGGAEGQTGAPVGPGGRSGQPLPEELQHAALLAALQALQSAAASTITRVIWTLQIWMITNNQLWSQLTFMSRIFWKVSGLLSARSLMKVSTNTTAVSCGAITTCKNVELSTGSIHPSLSPSLPPSPPTAFKRGL